jgi:hypothetical protein
MGSRAPLVVQYKFNGLFDGAKSRREHMSDALRDEDMKNTS